MKPKDPDTFIDIGVSITRLLLIASGQGTAASLIGEGAGLLKNLRSGGQRAVSAEKIAADVAARLPRESWDISEADWHAAATHVAPLIDRLSEKDRLAAGYDGTALRPVLLDLGGEERRRKLADESARRAFDWVLDVACQRIADLFTEKEALASLLKKVNEDCARLQRIERLLDRPGVQETSVVITDHIEVLRHLVPDALVDREQELADLEAFVRNSDGVWYAMEADMVSGKTTVMASFALNPPDDVHMASFFIRRIGGDGNDRGRFAFVMGAQLAKILGHEYTEPVRDPAQCTEFRQLLRRAATASRSATVPRTLVLLIDGIDEDSYFENPDGADAKSILSLLPRRLPEGVKIITASRPNPRLPEDVLCDANRRIVSLKPSPIAEKSINRKDMKIFFKSDIAVDIGAFLAACGGVLTVEDLRTLLIMRGHQRTLTWDVRAYVNRSPGRILTPIDVGFSGQEVLAYRLGHDVVTRAVIRELDPDSFGESDEPEDERWWAPIREKVLAPYRAIIRDWVTERASGGWGKSTPNYVLSGACFDLMLNDKKDDGSSVRVVLDRGRYDEMRRRSGRMSHVLRMIDRECFTILNMNRGELPEDATTSIFDVAESRKLLVQASTYIPGLPKLYVSYFNITPEVALDMIMAVDEPKDRLDALRETMKAAIKSGRGHTFLTFFLNAIGSLIFYQDIRDGVLRSLADVLVFIGNAANDYKVGDNEGIDLGGWLNEVLVSINMEEGLSRSLSSLENVDGLGEGAHVIEPFLLIAEDVAGRIEEPEERANALVDVVSALARAGDAEGARRVVEEAVSAAERINRSLARARVLVGVVGALARAGLTGEALAAVERIEEPWARVRAQVEVAGALARAGLTGEALAAVERIEEPEERARAQVEVAGALARAGDPERARRVAEEAVSAVERIEEPWARVRAQVEVAGALARAGLTGEALAAVERIEVLWARANALAEVAGALARAGDPERARRVAEEAVSAVERIEVPRARANALAEVAGALARADDPERARRVAEEAVSAVERIEEPWARVRAQVEVAGALARAGLTGEALAAVERIEVLWVRANALADVVGALARAGLTGEALAAVERIEEPEERARAQVEVAGALARAGDPERARRVAEEAVSAVERIEEPWARVRAQVEVAGALARAGLTGEALAAVERIEVLWARANALAEVAGALARAGLTGEALAAAKRIEVPWARAGALVEVAGALARAGRIDEALAAAEQIEEPEERARAQVEVAGALARAGRIDEALAAAEQIKDPEGRVRVLVEVAGALVRADDVERVRRVAENAMNAAGQIEDPGMRVLALAEVAGALARAGAIDEAREIVTMINEPSSRSRAQSAIIKALVGKGSSNEAVNMLHTAIAEVEGFVRRQDAADYCATLAAACLDAADLVDAGSTTHEQWLGLARSALARSWLYGASVWDRFDVLLRVAPDLATRLVEERLLADPEPSPDSEPDLGVEPRPSSGPDPEGPGGGAPSSR